MLDRSNETLGMIPVPETVIVDDGVQDSWDMFMVSDDNLLALKHVVDNFKFSDSHNVVNKTSASTRKRLLAIWLSLASLFGWASMWLSSPTDILKMFTFIKDPKYVDYISATLTFWWVWWLLFTGISSIRDRFKKRSGLNIASNQETWELLDFISSSWFKIKINEDWLLNQEELEDIIFFLESTINKEVFKRGLIANDNDPYSMPRILKPFPGYVANLPPSVSPPTSAPDWASPVYHVSSNAAPVSVSHPDDIIISHPTVTLS